MKISAINSIIVLSLASTALAHQPASDSKSGSHHETPDSGAFMTVVNTGQGAYRYQTVPGFGKIPDGSKLGPTHGGVAVDNQGLIYVSTDGPKSICVFKPDGIFVKSMAPEAAAIHGMQIHTEGDKQFISI